MELNTARITAEAICGHSGHFEGKTMFSSSFDILRKDRRGKPILLGVVGDLETARLRLSPLASLMPGEYFAFDPRTHRIVAAIGGLTVAGHISVNLSKLFRASNVAMVGEGK
jgi:hypothetical protein